MDKTELLKLVFRNRCANLYFLG